MSEITKALIKFHQQVGKIHKDARAQYGTYADLAGVLSTVTPVLSANGLAIVQTFLGDSLVTELHHESGEKVSSTVNMIVPQGRNQLHSWGASVTYMRRYQICSILGIVADMDTDGNVEEAAEPAKPKRKSKPVVTSETPSEVSEQPLTRDEYGMVIALLKEVHSSDPGKLDEITESFRKKFPDSKTVPLSQAITTQEHVKFIHESL